jgi:low affinity Fe/Cu permease
MSDGPTDTNSGKSLFERFAGQAIRWAGSPYAFLLAVCVILVWALAGPASGFSETWLLVINTVSTLVTFLMVFLIQQSQNKDSAALHIKLDELLQAMDGASGDVIAAEHLDEPSLAALREKRRRGVRGAANP